MAIYSFSVKPVSRLKGESAVKIAAYQSRGTLYDERECRQYDFMHKKDLLHSEIIVPANAPSAFLDRQVLWTCAERAEKRYDARMARVVIAALQNELPIEVQLEMVREFVKEAFISLGMCADIAVHDGKHKDQCNMHDQSCMQPDNPHLHLLLTDRPVSRMGSVLLKTGIGTVSH